LDIINGRWSNDTALFKAKRVTAMILFGAYYFLYRLVTGANSKLCRYSDYLAVLKKE